MNDFANLWDEAGASAEQDEAAFRMAAARAEASFEPFLMAATSQAEFDQRVVLAAERISSVASLNGITEQALVDDIRRDHSLLLEATASAADSTPKTASDKCSNCGGSGSVPAQGHEDADDVDNGHVVCPSCHGSGGKEEFEPLEDSTNYAKYHNFEAAKAPQPAQRGFDLYASLHTALQEGQDPLAWIQAQDPGNPTPEKPSEHLDHGDYSNSYSEVPSAAGVVGADKAAQASKSGKRDPRHPFGQPKTAVVETRVLHLIRDRDPDGGSKEPTAADYAAHKNWAVKNFGQDAWDAYTGSNWDERHEASKTAGRRHPFG